MKKVAKLVIIDTNQQYLIMIRNHHPTFGDDADLPGGTIEGEETPPEGMVREVREEAGIIVKPTTVRKLYEGSDYSSHGTEYALFVMHATSRPDVTLSWEHLDYQWVTRETFMAIASKAHDTYMQMVADVIKKQAASI